MEDASFNLDEDSICLRCGFCCRHWAVENVPGYDNIGKPLHTACMHLTSAEIKNGIWQVSSCKLHSSKELPKGCEIFTSKGICHFGLEAWNERKEDADLPDKIKTVIYCLF
jgi:hypothetical protein